MKIATAFLIFCVAASTMAYEIISDGEQEYLVVPIGLSSRQKRQTNFNFDTQSKRAQVSHTGSLINNNNHHLSGTGNVSKGIPKGPLSYGGDLQYTHKNSGSSLGVGAQHTKGFGTDVGVAGRYNFVNKPNTQIYAQGEYNRHFRGPFGTGKPNYGFGVGVQHRF